ncbi:2Fe-2S iron-sulfur cluster binding domain-containing protein [Halioglobus maricola]|uniref:2Fe-2S iron-sulfur cluster binding domain-containing protein n=1 Tax=Halioglobus maricola TaxID=2601894 RepID=A0A5P9NN20_9GAMM|nr:2Fe-2S iron-sulfur cluster-binding protein [Halioglobus maricola]QFU77187.1 2Fe-2S iron-sulfur cluster binding domain-containing protein [Halioglobus maricola]
MPKLVFENIDGSEQIVEAPVGHSVMLCAVEANVEAILADCGGACSCATCHCYVEGGVFPDPDPIESQMLGLVEDLKPESRLSCQLDVTDEMDGLRIKLPASQG